MDDMTAFEQTITKAATLEAGPIRSVDDAAIVRTAVDAAQAGRWSLAIRRKGGGATSVTPERSYSVLGAAKFAVAAVIVALFGGFLLAGLLAQQASEEAPPAVGATPSASADPTDAVSIMLPTEIAADIRSGVLETPLGKARWVHLRGDHTTLPMAIDPMPLPTGGFVSMEPRGNRVDNRLELWRSPDLTSWTVESAPIQAERGDLALVDDMYWLTTTGPVSLWRSSDATDWSEVSLSGLTPPGPDGYAWQWQPGPLVADQGVAILPLIYTPDYSLLFLGIEDDGGGRVRLSEVEPGVYEIPDGHGDLIATVRFEDVGDGLRVIDNEDGSELTTLDGISLEYVERWASGDWPGAVHRLGILAGDALADLDLPDTMSQALQTAFFVDDSGFGAYTLGPERLVHVHRSEDGRDWTRTSTIGDDPGEPTSVQDVRMEQGAVVIRAGDVDWISPDGLTWQPRDDGDEFNPGDMFDPGVLSIRFPSGWLYPAFGDGLLHHQDPDFEPDTIWYRPDGGAPIPIDISELTATDASLGDPVASYSAGAIGPNTVFNSHLDGAADPPQHLWIITFDEVPM